MIKRKDGDNNELRKTKRITELKIRKKTKNKRNEISKSVIKKKTWKEKNFNRGGLLEQNERQDKERIKIRNEEKV